MPSYKLTSLAEADLISIWLYIAEDNSDAADNVLDYLHLQCGVVSKNPQLGKLRKDLAENIFVYLAGKSGWRSKYYDMLPRSGLWC